MNTPRLKTSMIALSIWGGLSLTSPAVFASQDGVAFPKAEWAHHTNLDAIGFQKNEVADIEEHLKTQNTQSLHVSVNGREVYAYGDVSDNGYVASIRKSVLAMMYGKYVKDGTIKLDATLEDMGMDDVGGLLPIERSATVKDLITARSGIYHPAANSGDSTAFAPERGSQKPGTYYLYNNWDFNASGGVFEKMTGKNLFQDMNEQIALPLGLQDFVLEDHKKSGNPERSQYLAYHMNLSARDMGRIGHLMLQKGNWDGNQLIEPTWVDEMVFPHTQNNEMNPAGTRASGIEYGYMWWVFDDDTSAPEYQGAYAGRGHYGQYLLVLPALDMVISHKTARVRYKTPEEYEKIRVTWGQFLDIADRIVKAKTN